MLLRYVAWCASKNEVNLHLFFCVLKHRDQKYFGEVSFWPAEYRNQGSAIPVLILVLVRKDPRKFPLLLILRSLLSFRNCSPEMHDLHVIFCFMQFKQQWNHIIIYKYTYKGNFRKWIFWHYLPWYAAPVESVNGGQNFNWRFEKV
jgi:hypothetical protein